MTDPTATETRNGAVAEAQTWGDIAWNEPYTAPVHEPPPPRQPRPPSRRTRTPRRRGPSIARATAVLMAPAVLFLLLTAGPSGPARFGPIPATGEGPFGQVVLNGPWKVASDPSDRGAQLGWQRGSFAGATVGVPHVVNASPITGPDGSRNFAGSVAWYRTAVRVPRTGSYAVRFGSVNHLATVWLDGRLLGSHAGTYLPFDERFHAAAGTHTLVVRADWRDPGAQAAAGFHRTWFNFGGINRPVTLRPIGPSEILAPMISTRVTGAGADVSVSVVVHNNAGPRVLQVQGTLIHGDQRVGFSFPARRLAANSSAGAHTTVHIDGPALWQPGQPNLYDFDVEIPSESGYHARVGLRQLTWTGGHLRLNGHPLLLHGASIQEDVVGHGDALTGADQSALVASLKSLGANATRAQHPLDIGLLQRLDAAGILVWQGVGPVDPAGAWSATTPALLHNAQQRVRTTVRQDALHPSVVAWNLANEVAGNGHSGGEASFIQQMARELHRTDPGRMVAVDVWGEHPPLVAGSLYSDLDAVGLTNYEGWYEDPLASQATIAARIRSRVLASSQTFAGKVLVVSEFGAEANGSNASYKPGGYGFQARLIGLHLGIYRHLPQLSGMLVWDLRDFAVSPNFAGGSISRRVPGIQLVKGINQKGLFNYLGDPKPAVAVVQRAFRLLRPLG